MGGHRSPNAEANRLFIDFCSLRREALSELLAHRQTQTHEVRRAAVIATAFASLREEIAGRPVALLDVGAAAGLNLMLDQYGYQVGDEQLSAAAPGAPVLRTLSRGAKPPTLAPRPLNIAARLGLDTDPLDVLDEDAMRWLRACIWPEELERVALLDQATGFARARAPRVEKGDAVRDLLRAVATLPNDLPLCVMHTIMLAYLDDAGRASFAQTLGSIAATRETYWVSLEAFNASPATALADDAARASRRGDALLSVGRWRGGWEHTLVAFASMHGLWVEWLARPRQGRL